MTADPAETAPGQQSALDRAIRLLQACVTIDELASTASPQERLQVAVNQVGKSQQRAETAAASAAAVAAAQALASIADFMPDMIAALNGVRDELAETRTDPLASIERSLRGLYDCTDRGALLVQRRG